MIKHNISLNQASTALLVGKCSTFLIKLQNLARWSIYEKTLNILLRANGKRTRANG